MKKLLFCLLALVVVFSISGCSSESKYKKYIEELNQKSPQDNGGSIRLDKMVIEDNAFKCYYTILVDVPIPSEEELALAKDMLIVRVKNETEFKPFRDDKLDFYFVYMKKDGDKMWDVKVTPADYL